MSVPDSVHPRSPVYAWHEERGAQWGHCGGASFVRQYGDGRGEGEAVRLLGLCDLSGLSKVGFKGAGAEDWLRSNGIDVPKVIYDSTRVSDGGVAVCVGTDEFLLESGIVNRSISEIGARLDDGVTNVVLVERQDVTFLLTGARTLEVLAQSCGINFREAPSHRLVLTRVAGVSCGVFPETVDKIPVHRLWVDPSYAVYLWETLAGICEDLGGQAVGAGCLYP